MTLDQCIGSSVFMLMNAPYTDATHGNEVIARAIVSEVADHIEDYPSADFLRTALALNAVEYTSTRPSVREDLTRAVKLLKRAADEMTDLSVEYVDDGDLPDPGAAAFAKALAMLADCVRFMSEHAGD